MLTFDRVFFFFFFFSHILHLSFPPNFYFSALSFESKTNKNSCYFPMLIFILFVRGVGLYVGGHRGLAICWYPEKSPFAKYWQL